MRLKTDSFVVENNVHFPTDYNLLWDCIRKSIDMIEKLMERHPSMTGWRKRKSWRRELKSLMRELGRVSSGGGKQKEERLKVPKEVGKILAETTCWENSIRFPLQIYFQ